MVIIWLQLQMDAVISMSEGIFRLVPQREKTYIPMCALNED